MYSLTVHYMAVNVTIYHFQLFDTTKLEFIKRNKEWHRDLWKQLQKFSQ